MDNMKKFGERFDEYEPIKVEHVSFFDTDNREIIDKDISRPLRMKKASEQEEELRAEMKSPIVEVAPTANAYQISPDQEGVADFIKKTLTWYNYYVVELGLNVMVGRESTVPELLFKVVLKSDKGPMDAVAYDIAPKDETRYKELLSGNVKINLGISALLKFVPFPLGEYIPDLLNIEINPWQFKWGITKYNIDACGEKDCNIYWKIYETEMVQGFNPTIIVRAKKEVEHMLAGVRCVYKIKSGRFATIPEFESKEKEVPIW